MDTKSALDKQSKQDVVESLYSNSFGSIMINFILASGIVFTFDNPLTAEAKVKWWLVFVVVLVARLADSLIWKKQLKNAVYNNEIAIYRFIIGLLATCILWAFYCVFIVNQVELLELTFIVVIVSSMAGGGATILAAHKTAAIAYSFIILVPFSISLLLSDEKSMSVIGLLGLALFVVLFLVQKNQHILLNKLSSGKMRMQYWLIAWRKKSLLERVKFTSFLILIHWLSYTIEMLFWPI